MNRQRLSKQQRRHSLPATSSLSPFGCLSVPEGSDTFQKALEELYTSEPNHAPTRSGTGFGLHGLNNILEGNESDYAESEEDVTELNSVECNDAVKMNRRHSSPSCLAKDDVGGDFKSASSAKKINSLLKSHNKYRKEYFIKHGHWPAVNGNKPSTPRNHTKPKSFQEKQNRSRDSTFGATSLTSNMAKLRI